MVPGPSAADLARQHAAGTTPPTKTVEQAFARAVEADAGPNGLNAILWDDREAALGAAMRLLATDEATRRTFAAGALARARALSWTASARATLAALREAAA